MKTVLTVAILFSLCISVSFAQSRETGNPPQQGGAESSIGQSIENGMWLCLAPTPAINFWEDLILLQKTGITVSKANVESIAQKYKCEYFMSDRFKLVDVGGSSLLKVGQPPLKVTNGNSTGWVPAQEYLQYMRYHVVRKP